MIVASSKGQKVKLYYLSSIINHIGIYKNSSGDHRILRPANCIPRTKYVRGILWFSRRYAAASADTSSPNNLKNPYRIASIFYM